MSHVLRERAHLDLIDAVILGIVEGITEYLPVSSTGHLILTAWLLGLDETWDQKRAVNAFNIVIQGGAILAVLGLYRQRVWQMIRGLFGKDPAGLKLALLLFVAFLPAALSGPFLDDWIEKQLFKPVPVVAALFLGGVLLLGIRRWQDARFSTQKDASARFISIEELTWKAALIIGLLQCVAMWPGTSRSMMTIVGGMMIGLRPRQAAEFSFLLGLPTLGGACVFKLGKTLLRDGNGFIDALGGWMPLVVGTIVAAISSAIAIRWLIEWLSTHGFVLFGIWRIAIAIAVTVAIAMGWLDIQPPTDEEISASLPTPAASPDNTA